MNATKVQPKTNERLLGIASMMIKNGQLAKQKFADWFQKDPGQALECSDAIFLETARLEVGEWLHMAVAGNAEPFFDQAVEIIEGRLTSLCTEATRHTSSEGSNTMQRARIQAIAELKRRLVDYDY